MNGRATAGPAMLLPDYAGGSLLNLMASIEAACGGPGRGYAPLRQAPPELGTVRHLVLLVVDGMGEVLLQSGPAGAFMRAQQRGVMTSVFPTTTASAITTVLTGLAPAAHGLTGWHVYSGELNQVIAPLPLWARGKRHPDPHAERWCKEVFVTDPLADRLARACHVVSPWFICDSPYNLHHTGQAERWPYRGLDGLFETLEKLLRQADTPTYTYAYYGEIDRLGHEFGIGSPQVATELAAVDKALEAFAGRIRGLDVGVVATADHGFLDNPPSQQIQLVDHPQLANALYRPLCGERRLAYAYVQPERQADFKAGLARELDRCVTAVDRDTVLAEGWYGPGPAHPRLAERVGELVLVMQAPWVIIDQVPGERPHDQVGVHGGVSAAEMQIPLIFFTP